jgi:hypothetical protein
VSPIKRRDGKEGKVSKEGARYLGDVLFDRLTVNPGFIGTARELVASDWRTGTNSFQEYVKPSLDEVFAVGDFKAYGDLSYTYLARRVMDGALDAHRNPWLWAYDALIGALVDPAMARAALNAIQSQQGGEGDE